VRLSAELRERPIFLKTVVALWLWRSRQLAGLLEGLDRTDGREVDLALEDLKRLSDLKHAKCAIHVAQTLRCSHVPGRLLACALSAAAIRLSCGIGE
jgi:hypothetical protein